MKNTKSYRMFRIEVRSSPHTNDHEVRFIADEEDIIAHLEKGVIGLDPDDILVEPCPLRGSAKPHRATVARCDCGVIGCGDIEVEVRRSQDIVEWETRSDPPQTLQFPSPVYDAEVERALHDTSWETPDRTAARILGRTVDRENPRAPWSFLFVGIGTESQGDADRVAPT